MPSMKKAPRNVAVIMAGGRGTRFWPRSRGARPKQFLAMVGDEPLLTATVHRLRPLFEPQDIYVVTTEELAGALVALAETKDAGKREAWAKRGAAFFQGKSRRSAPASDRDTGGAPTQPDSAQPASGATGAA